MNTVRSSYLLIDSSEESNQTPPKLGDWKDSQEFTYLVVKFANKFFKQFLNNWKQRVDNTGLKTHHSVFHIPGKKRDYKPAKKASNKYHPFYFKPKHRNECEKVLFPGESMSYLFPKEKRDRKSKFYHYLAKQVSCMLKLKFKDMKEQFGKEIEYNVTLFNPKKEYCPNIKITAKLVPSKFASLETLSDRVFSKPPTEHSSVFLSSPI